MRISRFISGSKYLIEFQKNMPAEIRLCPVYAPFLWISPCLRSKQKFIPSYLHLLKNHEDLEIKKTEIYYEDFLSNLNQEMTKISQFLETEMKHDPKQIWDQLAHEVMKSHKFASNENVEDFFKHSKDIPEDKFRIYYDAFINQEKLKRYFHEKIYSNHNN
jgi:hypothetical protein